jgi:hypothetical protein
MLQIMSLRTTASMNSVKHFLTHRTQIAIREKQSFREGIRTVAGVGGTAVDISITIQKSNSY